MLAASISLGSGASWAQRDQVWKLANFRHTTGAGTAASTQERQRLLWELGLRLDWQLGLMPRSPVFLCPEVVLGTTVCHFSG